MNHQSFSFQFIQFLQFQTERTNKLTVQLDQLVHLALIGRNELTELKTGPEAGIPESRTTAPAGPMGTFQYRYQN